jgi:fatty acid desaturase
MIKGSEWHRELRDLLRAIGAFDRDPVTSITYILGPLVALTLCFAVFAVKDLRPLAIPNAFLFAFTSVQLGFVMHDAGHGSLFRHRWANDCVGLLAANLLTGLSYGWWVHNHNGHHANPNVNDTDPDLAMIRMVFALSPQDLQCAGAFRRWLGRKQVILAPMLFTLQIFGLKYFGLRYLLTEKSRWRVLEALLIVLHHVAYFGFLLYFLGMPLCIIVALIHHLAAGFYLTTVVSTNHIARPLLAESESDLVLRQAGPSRNVRTPAALEFLWGGLNYQIEHHLFPAIRRDHIRAALPIVRKFCVEREIPYHETGFVEGYREIFRLLSAVTTLDRT